MLIKSKAQGDPLIYRTFIRNRFTVREVVVSPVPLNALMAGKVDYNNPNFADGEDRLELERCRHPSDEAPQDRSLCCGTMQLPEYTVSYEVLRSHGFRGDGEAPAHR
jgi:hypothetical protein